MNKWDYIFIFGIIIVLLAGIFFFSTYYRYEVNKCTSNPLVYGARDLEDRFGLEVIGSVQFLTKSNQMTPILRFNSKEVYLE